MRILHLSDTGLPDWRLQKTAMSDLKIGHQIFFAGAKLIKSKCPMFTKIYEINWTAGARRGLPVYWSSVKKQMERILREIRPDVIHAHNIFSAKMASEFGFPFVYNDYEYWSKHSLVVADAKPVLDESLHKVNIFWKRAKKAILDPLTIKMWTKWEKELVSLYPTITVSNRIADDFKKIGGSKKILVIPNFPLVSEISWLSKPEFHSMLSSVYAGSDGNSTQMFANRNLAGFFETFNSRNDIGPLTVLGWKDDSTKNIKYLGYLGRQEMFAAMSQHSIGFIPWKKHWSHYFVNPNKPYEYAHAGLLVMCTSSLTTLIETLKDNCITFDDDQHLVTELQHLNGNMEDLYKRRIKIFDFARENLIWEKYENNISTAYKLC
jgi:hypothetical protein